MVELDQTQVEDAAAKDHGTILSSTLLLRLLIPHLFQRLKGL